MFCHLFLVDFLIILHYNSIMEDLKNNLANNLIKLRKAYGMKQIDLAEKLNYSDKAVSKWERAESMPDVEVLYQISKIFNVTIDMLLSDSEMIVKKQQRTVLSQKAIISLLSVLSVWVVATFLFVLLTWVFEIQKVWLVFIYAIPVSSIVALVFNSIWGKGEINLFIVSALLWTAILSIYLTTSFDNDSMIFFIAIPIQVCIILCYFLFKLKYLEKYFNKITKKKTKDKKQKN